MKLGIIGYANNSGLGIMTQDLINQFDIDYHLVIPGAEKGTDESLSNAKYKISAKQWTPSEIEVLTLLKEVDVVITVETTYYPDLFKLCKEHNVRSVFIPMWEWFEWDKYQGADMYICTSKATYYYLIETFNPVKHDAHMNNVVAIPWPVDTDKFRFRERGNKGKVFVHNAGFGGLNYRKGTLEVVDAFRRIRLENIKLILRTQRPIERYPFYKEIIGDKRIEVHSKDFESNEEMYEMGDIYLYPARYDGQALVAQEAMACGFPVFVTDAEPMNEFSDDAFFRVPLLEKEKIRIHNHEVDMNIANSEVLGNRMVMCMSKDLRKVSRKNREIIEKNYSWNACKQDYYSVIFGYEKTKT